MCHPQHPPAHRPVARVGLAYVADECGALVSRRRMSFIIPLHRWIGSVLRLSSSRSAAVSCTPPCVVVRPSGPLGSNP